MAQQRSLLFQRTQMLSACMGLLTTTCTTAPRDLMPFTGLQRHSHTWHSLTQKHTLHTHTHIKTIKIKFKSISLVAEVRLLGIVLLICNFPLYRKRVCAKFSLTLLCFSLITHAHPQKEEFSTSLQWSSQYHSLEKPNLYILMSLGWDGPEVLVSDERERTWIHPTRESKGREAHNALHT